MTAQTAATGVESSTARFGRLERRGVLLGLGMGQLGAVATGLLVIIAGVYTAGVTGLVTGAPLWGPLLALGTLSAGGRPLVSWTPVLAGWLGRAHTGRTRQISRPITHEQLHVPGLPRALDVSVAPTLGAALVHDRAGDTVTATARIAGSGFLLESTGSQTHRVDAWGRLLAALGRHPDVKRIQVLLRTTPRGEYRARQWWREHATAGAGWASSVLADLMETADYLDRRPEALLVVALRPPKHAGRRLSGAAVRHVEHQLATIADAVHAADLLVDGWVNERDLPAVMQQAYDPTRRSDPESLPTPGAVALGVHEHWRYLQTDSAVHATFWVTEWPRSAVAPGFLQPLVLAPGVQRTVSLIVEAVPVAAALREIRRAKAEHLADSAQRSRIGQVEDEATRAELEDLLSREQELVAGHADLQFTGLVTVTAPTVEDLEQACAATEAAAAQAMCEVRRLVGQQGLAHLCACLPLAQGVL